MILFLAITATTLTFINSFYSNWGVKIDKVTEFNVPKNSWVSEGKAASQGQGYEGGGYQAVIQNLPKSNIIRTDEAFK